MTGDRYLAGLWERSIDYGLSWFCGAVRGVKRSVSYAPSWSWASIEGGGSVAIRFLRNSKRKTLFKLIEARIVPDPPESGDPYGSLRTAELEIECLVYHFRWKKRGMRWAAEWELCIFADEAKTKRCSRITIARLADLWLDTSDLARKFKAADKIDGVCVPLWKFSLQRENFLLLEHDFKDRYRRIGMVPTLALPTFPHRFWGLPLVRRITLI